MLQIDVTQGNIAEIEADCIVVNLFEGVTEPGGATGAVNQALDGAIARLVRSGDFNGTAGTSTLLYTDRRLPTPRVLVVGLGKQAEWNLHSGRRAAAVAAKALRQLQGVSHFATIVHGAGVGGLDAAAAAQALAEGSCLATYRIKQYPPAAEKVNGANLNRCTVVEFAAHKLAAIQAGVAAGLQIAQGVYLARDLVNEPANLLPPLEIARRAAAMAAELGLSCTLLDEAAMAALGMGMVLAVSRGSRNEARIVILEHAPAGSEETPPLVLIGKGITFDTGGISIKASADMWRMKDDMAGAAAVIGAMEAMARLGVPRRVIGIAVCVENMPDGAAYRPGDILTGISGKTAEIISTDAEGRLVLADALGYVSRFKPAAVVDLATLTGAIGVALGNVAAGCFTSDSTLQDALLRAAEQSGERLWPMPMHPEYADAIKSDMAQVKNSGDRTSGVSTSAKFLEHFTDGYPWAHLDIAYMVLAESASNPLNPKGATGYGVRLLVSLAQQTAHNPS